MSYSEIRLPKERGRGKGLLKIIISSYFVTVTATYYLGGIGTLTHHVQQPFPLLLLVVAGWVGYEIIHGLRGNVVCVRKAIGSEVRGVGPLWQAEYGPLRMSTLESPETCENATFCGKRDFADVVKFRILQWRV